MRAKGFVQLHRSLGIPSDYAAGRRLKPQREATRLVRIGRSPTGRVLRLTPAAAAAWRRMQAAAARDGVVLIAISGFRSVRRQTTIIREKLATGAPIGAILRLVAAPGFSEHHTGRALDIGSAGHLTLEEDFGRTREFRWLQRHAGRFGFRMSYPRGNPHRIGYEPWHWCWRKVRRKRRPDQGV